MVAWTSSGQDGSSDGIFAQRFDAAGIPQGHEFQVNTHTVDRQFDPTIAVDADGDFVIAWTTPCRTEMVRKCMRRRYSAAGVPQGDEFRVNSYTPGDQDSPAVAIGADGDFVIAWVSDLQSGSAPGVLAQRYDASGAPQGDAFLVYSFPFSTPWDPSVALAGNGSFVISWSTVFGPPQTTRFDVHARRYDRRVSRKAPRSR